MADRFTRAHHPELDARAVIPTAALPPGWHAYGEPDTDPEALRAALALELQDRTREPETSAGHTAQAHPGAFAAPDPQTTAPAGADTEQE